MITIKNIKTLDGKLTDLQVTSSFDQNIEANGRLLCLPGIIDPHLSLGSLDRENWIVGLESAVRGGISTILDIPSENSVSQNKEEFEQKKRLVNQRLSDLKIPLNYFPYIQGNSPYFEELGIEKKLTKGVLLLFTPNDPNLDEEMWNRIFQIAAWADLPVVINAGSENLSQQGQFKKNHQIILEKAIYYTEKQNARLYVLNVSTQDEIDLIQKGRERSLLIYAETTPQYLFPRNPSQANFLWEALNNRIIETVGSGYQAELEEEEKLRWEETHFGFLNPIFYLPLLLTAYHEGKVTLENIVRLTRVNFYDIFRLERKENEDFILVDLEKEQTVQRINQIESEMKLKGWPEYMILNGYLFKSGIGGDHLIRIE